MTIRFLHAADIHLDSPLRGLDHDDGAPVEVICNASRRALGRMVDLALAEDVAFVLIAGDIYDGDWPDFGTGTYFANQMVRLTRAGKPVLMIRGNHDAANRMTRSLRLPEGVRVLGHDAPESVELAEFGVVVHGQSFEAGSIARDYPPPVAGRLNIGLLHTSLEQGAGLHDRYSPCSREDLVALGYDYWALGHIHARQVVLRDPWIVFPGNLQGRHINECGEKGATLVTVAGGKVAAAEHRPLDVFRWARVTADIAGCTTEEAALEAVAAALAEALAQADGRGLAVRIALTGATVLHGAIPDLTEKLRAEARLLSETIWIEGVEQQTGLPEDLALTARGDALGALARRITALADGPAAPLLGDWPEQLLSRLPPNVLPDGHPLLDPDRVLARARDLVLARLARD